MRADLRADLRARESVWASIKLALIFVLVAVIGMATHVAAAQGADLKPIVDYLRAPDYQDAQISPSGKRLALTQRKDETEALIVLDIEKGSVLSATHFGKDEDIRRFMWATEDRLLIEPGKLFPGFYDSKVATGELIGINYDGRGHRVLFGYRAGQGANESESRVRKKKNEFASASVIDLLPDEPRKVIIQKSYWGLSKQNPEAVKIDIVSGNTTRLASAPMREGVFVTDASSNVSLFFGDNRQDRREVYYRPGGKGEFQRVGTSDESGQRITPLHPLGNSAFWASGYGADDTQALYRWTPANNTYQEVYRHPEVDLQMLMVADKRQMYAVSFDNHFPDYYYPNPKSALARAHAGVRKAFPGTDAYFVSFTQDNSKAVLRVTAPQTPDEFKLVDLKTNSLQSLVKTRPWLSAGDLVPMEPFEIKSRDGMTLRGFTTLPRGKTKNLPFVVLVHGGPHGVQDYWGFDPEVQLLASRGYGVMQINYRGSGGRGSDFLEAGYRNWGTRMQDDVTDATRWLVQKGLADKDRLCIMGGSYGGYAALNGVVREPDMYKCAIGIVGVYDLTMMLREGDIPEFESGPAYLERVLGSDLAALRARSPVYHADKIKAGVLLAHGARDQRVPIKHAYKMRDALKAAGNPAQWLVEKREGHGFRDEDNLVSLYEKVFAFLGEHIGPGR